MNKKKMSRKITAKEVAKVLGISSMTVSRAFNNQPDINKNTRKKIITTAHKLGYFPNFIAKSLVINKTNTIGVIVPEITHSFFPEVISGIEEVCYNNGYHIILAHSSENANREKDAIYTLTSKQVDGILISTAQTVKDFSVYKQILKYGIHLVFYDRYVKGIGVSSVSIDDMESARKATNHLIQHGYYPIAHITGSQKILICNARLEGFKKALRHHNLKIVNELIIEAGLQEDNGYQAMKKIFKLSKAKWPRAIVAVNDPVAFGAMRAIYERKLRIPEDIAIIGFSNDIRSKLVQPPLTTVHQNAYEIGKKAVKKLIRLIEGNSMEIEEIIVKGKLIIRKSCGC